MCVKLSALCVCVCVCAHTHKHTRVYARVCAVREAACRVCVCAHTHTQTCVRIYTHVCVCWCISVCVCVCVCWCVCLSVRESVCMLSAWTVQVCSHARARVRTVKRITHACGWVRIRAPSRVQKAQIGCYSLFMYCTYVPYMSICVFIYMDI